MSASGGTAEALAPGTWSWQTRGRPENSLTRVTVTDPPCVLPLDPSGTPWKSSHVSPPLKFPSLMFSPQPVCTCQQIHT